MAEDNKKTSKFPEHVPTGKTLRYFYKIAFQKRPEYFGLTCLFIVIEAGAPFINIVFPKYIIDELMGQQRVSWVAGYVLAMILLNWLTQSLRHLVQENIFKIDDWFERYFTQEISKKAMDMDFEHTEDPDVLDQSNKAETGMSWYSGGINGLTSCMAGILSSAITLTGVITMIAIYAPIVLPVSVACVAVGAFITAKQNAANIRSFHELPALNRAFSYVYYNLSNFRYGKDIRLYGATDMMLSKAKKNNYETIKVWKRQAETDQNYGYGSAVLTAVQMVAIYLILGMKTLSKEITVGSFTMLISSSETLQNCLNSIIWRLQEIHKKAVFMSEYVKFMELKDVLEHGEKELPEQMLASGGVELEFRHVSFRYPRAEEETLKDVNLVIHAGEHLSVVGLNGAGKTTFIKLLCRLYDVTEGEILINGININKYEYDEYMRLLSVVFQDFKLFAFSIEENLLLGNPKKAEKQNKEEERKEQELLKLCELCGLKEKVTQLEKGLRTNIYKDFDESGIEPSGGEAQKIAIARALYKNSPIVILDEPTAALDPIAEYEIYRQFNQLVGGKTAVYISHRLSSCKFCDHIAVFSGKTIAEYGTHEELADKKDGIYAEMFQAQAQYYSEPVREC